MAGPYSIEAFAFVQDGLRYTVQRLSAEAGNESLDSRHVSGQELCIGLRSYALDQFGLLARTVLQSWGIYSTEDFGRIVFALVEAGLLRKSDDDSIEDFHLVFDFEDSFSPEAAEFC